MVKILDLDNLFEEYISDFVKQNIGKIKPEEIENQIPVLYEKFGGESLSELGGKTPTTYYKDFSAEELVNALITHIETGVSVSDYLCEAITEKDSEGVLLSKLESVENEEFTVYAMNILNDKKSLSALDKYLEIVEWDYPEPLKEIATEFLCENALKVKDKILERWGEYSINAKGYFCEILSNASGDERILALLLEQFALHPDEMPLYANYLAKFGDDKALPFLYTAIESEKINYHEFEELRFAIETLGGVYDKQRDFRKDKTYKKIKGIKEED